VQPYTGGRNWNHGGSGGYSGRSNFQGNVQQPQAYSGGRGNWGGGNHQSFQAPSSSFQSQSNGGGGRGNHGGGDHGGWQGHRGR